VTVNSGNTFTPIWLRRTTAEQKLPSAFSLADPAHHLHLLHLCQTCRNRTINNISALDLREDF